MGRVQLEVRAYDTPWDRLMELKRNVSGTAEVYLEDLREELAARLKTSGQLDECLHLRIVPLGGSHARYNTLQVGHYALDLELSLSDVGANIRAKPVGTQGPSASELDRLSLWTMSLKQPEIPWVETPRSGGSDGWHLDFGRLAAGPWLAMLRDGDVVRSRPRMLLVPGIDEQQPESAYARAAGVLDRIDRREAWVHLCSDMAGDWNHVEWNRFRDLLRTGGSLPAACFEVMQFAAES